MKVQKKESAKVSLNVEFPIPRKEEALNSRKRGGEFRPDFDAETSIVEVNKDGRTSTGPKSKFPYEVSRPGERRI